MYKFYLAWKFFASRKINIMSVFGIAGGVWLLTVVPSVMNGFIKEQRELIRGTLSDIIITPYPIRGEEQSRQYPPYEKYLEALKTVPHVEAAAPRIVWVALVGTQYGNKLLSNSQFKGLNVVQVVGVEPELEFKATRFKEYLKNEPLKGGESVKSAEKPFDLPLQEIQRLYGDDAKLAKYAVIFPETLYTNLDFTRGQRIVLQTMVFPEGDEKNGERQKMEEVSRKFYLAGSLRTGEYEIDIAKVYMSLEAARDLINNSGRNFTEMVVRLDDYQNAKIAKEEIEAALMKAGLPSQIETWEEQKNILLRAVNNERIIIVFLLSTVLLVSGITIFVILALVVSQKIRDIGVVGAIGGTQLGILSIFGGIGVLTGICGEILGGALGYLTVDNLQAVEMFIRNWLGVTIFDPKVYAFDHLPTSFSLLSLFMLLAATMLICVIASLLPAFRAAKLNPVEALRYE